MNSNGHIRIRISIVGKSVAKRLERVTAVPRVSGSSLAQTIA